MKNYIQAGNKLAITLASAVTSGQGLMVGSLFGVASTSVAANEPFTLAVTGVYELPKLEAQAWTVGAKVYWDDTNDRCTTVASGNTLIGVAVVAAANPSPLGTVRLDGVAR